MRGAREASRTKFRRKKRQAEDGEWIVRAVWQGLTVLTFEIQVGTRRVFISESFIWPAVSNLGVNAKIEPHTCIPCTFVIQSLVQKKITKSPDAVIDRPKQRRPDSGHGGEHPCLDSPDSSTLAAIDRLIRFRLPDNQEARPLQMLHESRAFSGMLYQTNLLAFQH